MLDPKGLLTMLELFNIGQEPTWLECSCGKLTSRVPCWECAEHERELADRRAAEASAESSIPKRFAWARLDAPELRVRVKGASPLETLAERILRGANAIVAGPSGTGKTSLAVACLRERGRRGLYVPAIRLATARRQHSLGDGEAGLVERAARASVLLIDDLGTEADERSSAVIDVVFERHDAERPTWITTGLSSREIGKRYGSGFLRRLLDGAAIVRLGETPADQAPNGAHAEMRRGS